MAWNLFPSQNSVGSISGVATRVVGYEPTFLAYMRALAKSQLDAFVVSGLTLSSPASNQVRIAAGVAIVNGCYVTNDANVDLTGLSNSTTYTIYATLNTDGSGFVSSITPDKTSGSVPANSVTIGLAVVNGAGAVTSTNAVPTPDKVAGTYTGDGVTDRTIWLGFTPKLVVVQSEDGTVPVGGPTQFSAGSPTVTGSGFIGFPSGATNAARPGVVTNGFVVSAFSIPAGSVCTNANTRSYRYLAFA